MTNTLELTPLDGRQMQALFGGATPDGGEAFVRDALYALGATIGTCWYALTHPPQASYSYAKVGY